MQYARRAAAVYANACQAIEDSKTETSHLNVGITPTAGETIIPQVLATLCNENPGHTYKYFCEYHSKNL